MRSNKIMMGRMRMVAVAAVLVVAGGFGNSAGAQEKGMSGMQGVEGMPGMPHEGGMPMGQGMGHEVMMGPGMMMCRMGEHVEGRLAYLKAELKITDAQTPQWNAFADAYRAVGKKAETHCATMTEHCGIVPKCDPIHGAPHSIDIVKKIGGLVGSLFARMVTPLKNALPSIINGMPASRAGHTWARFHTSGVRRRQKIQAERASIHLRPHQRDGIRNAAKWPGF